MRVLNAPNGQEIKLNVQRFCHLVPTDITLVMLKFGCQPQVCSKWLKVLWSCRRWGKKAQCAMWQMWVLGNVNFKAYYAGRYSKHCGNTEYSESLLDQYYKHYEHVCSCFPDAKPQEYQSLEKASLSRESLFIPAYSGTNQEGKRWKKHLCSKHVYKAKKWKSDKLAPALPSIPHDR